MLIYTDYPIMSQHPTHFHFKSSVRERRALNSNFSKIISIAPNDPLIIEGTCLDIFLDYNIL